MRKAIIGLSGGADSSTLLGILLSKGFEVYCCSFHYGSKHNSYEREAVENVINYYKSLSFPVVLHKINLNEAFNNFKSNLLKTGEEIPEGHYEGENMKLTVVPGRNMIFTSIMAGLAESVGAQIIALGVHAGDHTIYPDCRHEFIKALDVAIYLSSDRKVEIVTPLIKDDKAGILKRGYELIPPVPYHLTRTCYKDQPIACGKCGSCWERREAFYKIGIPDPIEYE